MNHRYFLLGAALVAVFLTGCATPATRVVLLPQPDGSASAVVVRAREGTGNEVTLATPYQRATAPRGSRTAPQVDQADPATVQEQNKALFEMAPPPAQHYTVYFEAGGSVLTPESQQTLEQALTDATARSGGDIVITGHTDTAATHAINDELSAQRARQVRQLLVDRQFPAARIEAAGRGERELAVPTADEVDEPRNRRVTIEVR